MNHSPTLVLIIFISLYTASCNSGEKTTPNEPVFGIYQLKIKGKTTIELNPDSTVLMDVSFGSLQKKLDIVAEDKAGVFTMRNDSIFINWKDGKFVKSKFERNNNVYSFRIGSTTYQRKL